MTLPTPHFRVLHVIDSLGLSGGAEQQLASNLHRFSDPRLEHYVLCLYAAPGKTRSPEIPADVPIAFLLPQGRRTRNRLSLIARLYRLVRKIKPALIHCTLPDASLAARIAGFLAKVPVIESLVNISHEPVRRIDNPSVTRIKLGLHRLVDRLTMRGVSRFHVLSDAVARSWGETVGLSARRMIVIPRGLHVQRLGPNRADERLRLLDELGIASDAFLVLNVGRQVAQKGQLYALRAMPAILHRVPGAVLVSAGREGGMTDTLRAECERLGIASRVTWLGVRGDITSLLAAADVFVFPSLYEGLGVSLLEAMFAGLPVVTSDIAPMNEVVIGGQTGLLVPPRDPEAIAAAVLTLANDRELCGRLGDAARAYVIAHFNVDDMARRLEGLYLDVLGIGSRANSGKAIGTVSVSTGRLHGDATRGKGSV